MPLPHSAGLTMSKCQGQFGGPENGPLFWGLFQCCLLTGVRGSIQKVDPFSKPCFVTNLGSYQLQKGSDCRSDQHVHYWQAVLESLHLISQHMSNSYNHKEALPHFTIYKRHTVQLCWPTLKSREIFYKINKHFYVI